jgi:hypothetical protein
MRTPVFELHIRPMFRATDREHMQRMFGDEFDLWDYETVKGSIDNIIDSIELKSMPPDDSGGPWPPEWILLLHRWKLSGFKRLQLGAGKYELVRSGEFTEVVVRFTLPAPGWRGWLQLETGTESARTYVLYFEAPDEPETGAGEEVVDSDQFTTAGIQKVVIKDADGLRELPVPAG